MPANIVLEVFVIEAASQGAHQPGEERYVIRTQLNNGQWTAARRDNGDLRCAVVPE